MGWGGGCEGQVTVSCQSIDTGAEGPKLRVSKASVYLPDMNEALYRASSVSRDDKILIPEANQAVGFAILCVLYYNSSVLIKHPSIYTLSLSLT